jgi:hypothetical protein
MNSPDNLPILLMWFRLTAHPRRDFPRQTTIHPEQAGFQGSGWWTVCGHVLLHWVVY